MTEHIDPDDTAQYKDEFAEYGPLAHRRLLGPEFAPFIPPIEPTPPVEVPPALRGPAYTPQPTYTPPSPGWNGEPCEARRITAVVADNDAFPGYWAREFVGTRRNVVEVTYGGQTFYLDDEGDFGWIKVTSGGSPHLSHSNITIDPDTIELRGDVTPEVQGDGPDEDSCALVDVDGETLRVRGGGEMGSEAQAALTEVVRAARKKMIAEQRAALGKYPYQNDDVTVLGPGVFASADGQVISWKGEDYTRQEFTTLEVREDENPDAMRELAAAVQGLTAVLRRKPDEQTHDAADLETADGIRAEAQRDRDQHAAVLREVLDSFSQIRTQQGFVVSYQGGPVHPDQFDQWSSVIAPTVERPWWEQLAEARAEEAALDAELTRIRRALDPDDETYIRETVDDQLEMRAAIERVRERCQSVRDREGPGGMINASQILGLLSPTWPDGNYEAPAPDTRPLDDEAAAQFLVDRPFRSLRKKLVDDSNQSTTALVHPQPTPQASEPGPVDESCAQHPAAPSAAEPGT